MDALLIRLVVQSKRPTFSLTGSSQHIFILKLVDHVHFHVIPKPNAEQGLGISWPVQETSKDDLVKLHEELKGKL